MYTMLKPVLLFNAARALVLFNQESLCLIHA